MAGTSGRAGADAGGVYAGTVLVDDVEVRSLRVFAAVLEARHVGRAARALGVGQPTASHHLKRLRGAFGDPLFVRDGQSLRPTPRALALEPRVRALLRAADDLAAPDALFDPRAVRREVRIASLDYERLAVLARAAAAICREAPAGRVALVARSPHDLDALAEGTLDAVVGPRFDVMPGGLRRRLLYRDQVTCVVRHDHPLARRSGPPSLDDYVAYPHVSVIVEDTKGNAVDAFLARRSQARHTMARVAGFEAACALVAQTDALALLPASLAPRARALGLAVLPSPLEPKTFAVYLFWHESVHHDPLHAWLRETIVGAAPGAGGASVRPAPIEKRGPPRK
jgi:LysR family transcriptional regulator, mexEF-oprN operon transcriptional activator